MEKILQYVYGNNNAIISIWYNKSDDDALSLSFTRKPDCDVEIKMRPDEALIAAAMLAQAVAMVTAEYRVNIEGGEKYNDFRVR